MARRRNLGLFEVTDLDAYWVMNSQLVYDSVYLRSCQNCRFCLNCRECSDSAFLFDCRNVQHCFMCSNLRNRSYCAFNKQLTKAEYREFMKPGMFADYSQVLQRKAEFRELLKQSFWPPSYLENTEDCSGNYLTNCTDIQIKMA